LPAATWIDAKLAEADDPTAPDRLARLRNALLVPLGTVYGVSDKIWSKDLIRPADRRWAGPCTLG
jgi:hypothetical protein